MQILKLYKFNNVISLKMPLFNSNAMLTTLNDLIIIDQVPTEIVSEYTVLVPDDFLFENYKQDLLLNMCSRAKEVVDYHFVTTLGDIILE